MAAKNSSSFDFSVIRNLRMKWGMTAEELARKAKLTRATILKIECGTGNPTIGTIEALADVFSLAPSELVRLAEKNRMEHAQTSLFEKDGFSGTRIWFPDFEVFHIMSKAGTHSEFEIEWHENTAEICLVLKGRIKLYAGGETSDLGAGTAIRFKALQDHSWDVIEDAEFLFIHHNLI